MIVLQREEELAQKLAQKAAEEEERKQREEEERQLRIERGLEIVGEAEEGQDRAATVQQPLQNYVALISVKQSTGTQRSSQTRRCPVNQC